MLWTNCLYLPLAWRQCKTAVISYHPKYFCILLIASLIPDGCHMTAYANAYVLSKLSSLDTWISLISKTSCPKFIVVGIFTFLVVSSPTSPIFLWSNLVEFYPWNSGVTNIIIDDFFRLCPFLKKFPFNFWYFYSYQIFIVFTKCIFAFFNFTLNCWFVKVWSFSFSYFYSKVMMFEGQL